jgi:RND family efflux transporter MFP subunit
MKHTVVIAGLLVGGFLHTYANAQPKASGVPVTTASAYSTDWAVSIPAEGEILPWEVAILSAKTEGIAAIEIGVLDGDLVHKGQVLAKFDDRLLNAELARAKAELAHAIANYQLAAVNLKRFAQLRTKQSVSEQEYELVSNQAAVASAMRDQAAAALRSAEIKLADAVVIATDTGKVLERNIELGQVPQNGQVLFRLLRQQKLEWEAKIDAAELTRVKPAMAARVTLQHPSNPAKPHIISGKIRSVSPQLDSSSRLATVRVILDGAPEVAINTYVEGKILVGNTAAVVIPANCMVVKDGKTWVFKVIKNNVAKQILVNVGRRQQGEIEITSGINAGDVLVQEGAGFLNDGDKLSIKTAKPKPTLEVGTR